MKIAFILYQSRSGSTYLASQLSSFRNIFVTPETHYVSRILEYPHEVDNLDALKKLISYLFKEKHFSDLEIPEDVLLSGLESVEFPAAKKDLIELITYTIIRSKGFSEKEIDICVIKHPPFKFIKKIESLWPESYFIHIIRDPRAIYNSQKTSRSTSGYWMSRNPIRTAINWKRRLNLDYKPSHYLLVKYEDLVRNKELVLNEVREFLGAVNSDEKKGEFDYRKIIGKSQLHLHTNIGKKLDDSNIDKWTANLSASELFYLQLFCKDKMAELKYDDHKLKGGIAERLGLVYAPVQFIASDVIKFSIIIYHNLFIKKIFFYRLLRKFS